MLKLYGNNKLVSNQRILQTVGIWLIAMHLTKSHVFSLKQLYFSYTFKETIVLCFSQFQNTCPWSSAMALCTDFN